MDYPSNAAFLAWSIISVLVWWGVAGTVVVLERRQARGSTQLSAA